MKKNNKGFTLAELLIVVAIIAVLVAIAIPVFTTQLERSREATDLSNIRAAYAEAVAEYLANGATAQQTATVSSVKQQTAGWDIDDPKLYTRIDGTEAAVDLPDIKTGDTVTVTVAADGTTTVTKGAAAGGGTP